METKPSRTRWIWLGGVAALTLAFVGRVAWVFWLPGGPRGEPIAIGPDTTRILGPADPKGGVDYIAALNERDGAGATSERNAAIPLLRAIGPRMLAAEGRERILAALGIDRLPEEGSTFTARPERASKASASLWPEGGSSEIASWLRANEGALALAKDAAERPRFFLPLVAGPAGLGSAVVEAASAEPEPIVALVEALATRGLGRAAEGRIEEARSDLLAVHGLARRIAAATSMPLRLAAVGLEVLACRCDVEIAGSGRLSEAQGRGWAEALDSLGPLVDPIRVVDEDERYACLSMALALARECGDGDGEDWNGVLRAINAWYDALVEAERRPIFAERARARRELREEVSRRRQAGRSAGILRTAIEGLFGGRDAIRASQTREIADLVISLSAGIVAHLLEFERAAVDLDLARTALRLAAFRASRGAYPESLAELVPEFAKEIPEDRFCGAALLYRRAGSGCIVWSVGPNGADDGGERDRDSKDDLAAALP